MAAKVGSSSRLQSAFFHDKPIDVKRQSRCKARKSSKDEDSTNDIMKILTQTCEQTSSKAAMAVAREGAARRPTAAAADEMIAAAAAAAVALSPQKSSLKRVPRTSTTPAASHSGLNFRSSNISTAKKTQPNNESSAPREGVSIHRRCCDLSEDDIGKNRKTSSNKMIYVEPVDSRETGRARSTSSVKRQNIIGSNSPSNIKTHCDVSKTTIEHSNMPREPLQTRGSRRQIRAIGRSGETVWNPLVPANMVTVPAERPDAVADAAGDAESRAARNFSAQEQSLRSPGGRRARVGPEGPPSAMAAAAQAPAPTSHSRGGPSPSRHRASRARRNERRDERGWKPWPLQGITPPVIETTHSKCTTARHSRESSPSKTTRRRKSRLETKYLEASSRESSPRKDTSKPRTTSRSRGGGGGTCVPSSVWEGSCDGVGVGKTRKASRKRSTHKKRRSPENNAASPSRGGTESRQTVIDDMCGYVSTRHLREHLEAWEDLVVEKGHRRSTSRTMGRAKSKKQRAEKVDSQTEIATKKIEKPEKSILKKEKAPYHIQQASKENIDKDNVPARFSEKKKLKDISKTTVSSETPKASSERMKKHRQKASSEPPSRYKSPPKLKDKEEVHGSRDRSDTRSSDGTDNGNKGSMGMLFVPQTRDKLDIADITTAFVAENSPTFISVGDKICLGETQNELKSPDKWPFSRLDGGASGKLSDGLWAPVASDHSIPVETRPVVHLSISHSTCQGSGDDIVAPRKRNSACTVCSRVSTDTADSPNRALTPGLTVQERLELERGHDLLAFNTVEPSARVRSSTNPRSSEETGYSTRSRSVSAGTNISRNRHKKLVRKRRGAALASIRVAETTTRPLRSHQGFALRSDIPVKLSPFVPRPRKQSPNSMITWERAHHLNPNRGNVCKDRRTRKTKFKSPISNEAKRAMAGPQHDVEMVVDSEEQDGCGNGLDWKLGFAMEAALRVAALRESDSQADSSPTVLSSQENDSQASKDDYAESKESAWCPFVRRPLSAVPEEDSHCSSSNKDNPKSEFDLDLIFKHKQANETEGDKVISAVLNQIFRDGSNEIIVSDYERTLTDTTDRYVISPSSPTTVPISSDSTSRWRTKTDVSSTQTLTLRPSNELVGNGLNATTTTITTEFPFSTDLETRSEDVPSTQDSCNTYTKIENGEMYDVTKSSLKSMFMNNEASFLEASSTDKDNSLVLRTSYATFADNLDSFPKIAGTMPDLVSIDVIPEDSREYLDTETINDKETTGEALEEKGMSKSEGNISQTNSKPGVFIALDTLLMKYEESYSTSSADVKLERKLQTLQSSVDETKNEIVSFTSSASDSDQMSDNTYENIKSLPKSTDHADNITDITENITEVTTFRTEMKERNGDISSDEQDSACLRTESNVSSINPPRTDVKDLSSHSSISTNKEVSGIKSQEKIQEEIPTLPTSRNTHEGTQNVLEVTLHAPVASQIPLVRDMNTLPSMKDILPIPDRFVVQEGGKFKEPSTPFKFVLTVNLHGPTVLDSSVDGSEDFDRDSLSSRCTRCRSFENIVVPTSPDTGDNLKCSDPPTLTTRYIIKEENTPNIITKQTNIHKDEVEDQICVSALSLFSGESEVSDSDNLSTIPSVFNLEDIDDDQGVFIEKEIAPKPNSEVIECISNVCKHWRNSIESLCNFDEDRPSGYITTEGKQEDSFQGKHHIPPLPSVSNESVHNETDDGRTSNHVSDSEWKNIDMRTPKLKRRVSLKLFSDWDVLNHLADFSDMESHVSAHLSKERMDDFQSNTSSWVKSITNTSISVKGSLKRKHESKSTDTRDIIDCLTEILHGKTEEHTPLSSLSALCTQSEDTNTDFPLFHYLPQFFRKEIARDRETIIGQENILSTMMTYDNTTFEEQESDTFQPSENYECRLLTLDPQVDMLFENPINHEITTKNSVMECSKTEVLGEIESESFKDHMSHEDLFVMASCVEKSDSESEEEQYDSTVEDVPHSDTSLTVVYENKSGSPDGSRCSENTLVSEASLSKFLNMEQSVEERNEDEFYSPLEMEPEDIQVKQEQTQNNNITNLHSSVTSSDRCAITLPEEEEINRKVISLDTFYSMQEVDQHISNIIVEERNSKENFGISEHDTYKQASGSQNPFISMLGEKSLGETDINHMDRVIWEGVALTVLLDAAAIINRFMKTVRPVPEGKVHSPTVVQSDVNIPPDTEISFKSLEDIESEARHMDLTLKNLIYKQDATHDSSFVALNSSEKTVGPPTSVSSLESIESDSRLESSVMSGDETMPFTSGSESISMRQGTVVLIPTESSRNLSMYIQNPAWEQMSYSHMGSQSDVKSESGTARSKTRVREGFLSPTGTSTERLTMERGTSTMSNNSDWETISQSATNEEGKETEQSNIKVLESLWRRDSSPRAVNWDTSTETLGLVGGPLTTRASAPSAPTRGGGSGDGMQLVFMRPNVRLTESDDSAWEPRGGDSKPQRENEATTPSRSPPPSCSRERKSEAVQVSLPPSVTDTPPDNTSAGIFWSDDGTRLRILESSKPGILTTDKEINTVHMEEKTSRTLPIHEQENAVESEKKSSSNNWLLFSNSESGRTNEISIAGGEERIWSSRRTGNHESSLPCGMESMYDIEDESSLESESESDSGDSLDLMRRLEGRSWPERGLSDAWRFSRHVAYSPSPATLDAHHVTLKSQVGHSSDREQRPEVTNNIIAVLCLVFAVVVMNSILSANNIVVFK